MLADFERAERMASSGVTGVLTAGRIGNASPLAKDDRVDSWFFGMDAWAIQDGSYPDFRTGQTAEFDVVFYVPEWDIASDAVAPRSQRLDECRYSIVAEVMATLDHHAWVIDCGILAFRRGRLPEGLAKGSWIAGEVEIGSKSAVGPTAAPESALVVVLSHHDRLRGGPDAAGGAGRDAARGGQEPVELGIEALGALR